MFVYVQFLDDGERLIVPISDVRFKKEEDKEMVRSKEFCADKSFKVKFKDNCFYKARILAVGETMEELHKKRVRAPSRRLVEEDEFNSSQEESQIQNVVVKNKKVKNTTSNKENYDKILNEALNSSTNIENNNLLLQEIETLKKKEKTLKLENEKLKAQLDEEISLNKQLQLKLLDKWDDLLEKVNALSTSVNEKNNNENVTRAETADIEARVGENIYLGRGVWIPAHQYDTVQLKCKNEKKFIRELAVTVFGTHILSQSSVTGAVSNRTKSDPKPALEARKLLAIKDVVRNRMMQRGEPPQKIEETVSSVPAIISQKIQDINRGPRTKRTGNIEAVVLDADDMAPEGEFNVLEDGTLVLADGGIPSEDN